MALLSKSCEYGLRAMVYVAAHADGRPFVPIREIAGKLDISFHFLTKILQHLTEAGYVKSYRGPRGGVALARPAAKIPVQALVEAMEGPDLFRRCVLGLSSCGHARPCALHTRWLKVLRELKGVFGKATLAAVAAGVSRDEFRLADEPRRKARRA